MLALKTIKNDSGKAKRLENIVESLQFFRVIY